MASPPTRAQRLAARERPPTRPWMHHQWRELLFLHWRFDPDVIQRTLPAGLQVDTFDGAAWVGIVPFFMRGVRPVGLPPIPGLSNFQELNVRSYAFDRQGRPGVWFYSLDANCWPAVLGARWSFHLPYYWARMTYAFNEVTRRVHYTSQRRGSSPALTTEFDYQPEGAVRVANDPDSLEFFLIERYLLFAERDGRLYCGRVHHPPYELTGARLGRWDENALRLDNLPPPGRDPDHVVLSRGVDVAVFGLQAVG